jgi:hypothetical protein
MHFGFYLLEVASNEAGGCVMAIEEASPQLAGLGSRSSRTYPVQWWAVVGGGVLLVQAYTLTRWLTTGQATPTPTGPTPVPAWMSVGIHSYEVVSAIAAIAIGYYFLWRPWRREGRLSLDGMFVLAWIQAYFLQDPGYNYFHAAFSYSSVQLNLGSWTSQIPGWTSPNGHLMPEPLIGIGGLYLWGFFGGTVLCCAVMRAARRRFPSIGKAGLVAVAIGTWIVLDFVEVALMALGLWHYGGAWADYSLFPDSRLKFPLYEPLFVGLFLGAASCMRFFLDDRGRCSAERGIDQIKTSSRRATMLRFLAIVGMLNVLYAVLYNGPMQYFNMKADPWPQDVVSRSYLTNGLCGPGTPYACAPMQEPAQAPSR